VNNNGLLSFMTPILDFTPQVTTTVPYVSAVPYIAPFWADVDVTIAGDIYYRESTDPQLLERATSDIRTYFHDLKFNAQWIFVATWDQVAFHGSQTNKTNTFQVVLTSDGSFTFIFFNYQDIQWTTGIFSGGSPMDGVGGVAALAGLSSDVTDNHFYITGSLMPAIINVTQTSNVKVKGRWVFKVNSFYIEDASGNILDGSFSYTTSSPPAATTRPEEAQKTTTTDMLATDVNQVTTTDPTLPLYETDLLYPYGPRVDYTFQKVDNGYINVAFLTSLPIFGSSSSLIYIHTNGYFSVNTRLIQFTPQNLPVDKRIPLIAPFWADVDNQISGDIYCRISIDPNVLSRVTDDINSYFQGLNFSADWVLVTTWDRVTYHGSQSDKVNTFQAVLATDGSATFVIFNYGNIQWTTGTASGGDSLTGLGGIPALAGLSSGNNIGNYIIPESLSPAMVNISSTSNVNVPGRWVFRVDKQYIEDTHGIVESLIFIPPSKPLFRYVYTTDLTI
ncbi:unnamed protein product, partial [Ranitomeya imitator]